MLLGVLDGLEDPTCVLLKDIKPHLEDIVHFKLIAEALLLVICVDVAQGLTTS